MTAEQVEAQQTDVAVLVLGTPAPRRPRARWFVLGGAAALAGAATLVVLLGDPFAARPAPVRPVAAVEKVQQYTVAEGYTVKKVKRDRFTAVAVDPVEAAAASITLGPATPSGVAQEYAASAVARHGWSKKDFACLVALWNRESGWNTHAGNADGAYGIPQALPGSKMASAGGDWVNSAQTQIDWGLGYIAARYGSPCGAWAQSEATGSY